MNFKIRKATETDFPAILELIKELAEFEKAPEKVTNTVGQMLDEKELFRCFIASGESGEISWNGSLLHCLLHMGRQIALPR